MKLKSFKGKPITGSFAPQKPKPAPAGGMPGVNQAQQQVAMPATPFRNPNAAANLPAAGVNQTKIGNNGNKGGKKSLFYGK